MLIDEFLPIYDVVERHQIDVRASASTVYAAVRLLDLRDVGLVRVLFRMRDLPARLRPSGPGAQRLGLTIDELLEGGFVLLGDRPPRELLLGLVGRFWTPTGSLVRVNAAEFRRFDHTGNAKAVWNFSLAEHADGTVRLTTETRVRCSDDTSRKRFLLYWRLMGPFSGLIRRQMLGSIKRRAEASTD